MKNKVCLLILLTMGIFLIAIATAFQVYAEEQIEGGEAQISVTGILNKSGEDKEITEYENNEFEKDRTITTIIKSNTSSKMFPFTGQETSKLTIIGVIILLLMGCYKKFFTKKDWKYS